MIVTVSDHRALAEESLARLLVDHPSEPDDPLVCTVDREISAADFLASAEAVASELEAIGVGGGAGMAVQLAGVDMAAAMFGAWLAGAVFVPINPRQPRTEVERMVAAVRPAAFLGPDGMRQLDDPARLQPGAAFVTWTSGTTGPPKPILHTHSGYREILGRVLGAIRHSARPRGSGPERPTPNLIPVSLALNAGIYNLLFGFMAGASVVIMEGFRPADFATVVGRYQIRSTVLPPPAMVMLTDAPDVVDLSPLRYVRSITAPLSPLSARRFMDKFGVVVLNGYGQAEIGEVVGWTAEDARNHPDKLGAAGRAHPGVDVKVVDEAGAPLGPGETGQLLVRPPAMAAGYAGGQTLADRVDAEGFVNTGDYAAMDADGFVWIEGRATDLINRGGNKVFPDQVEEVIRLVPAVKDVAVVGVPDRRLGDVPVAFVVGDAAEEALVAACREHLVPYKIPVRFEPVDTIPRSEVGKVLRQQLAARLAGR